MAARSEVDRPEGAPLRYHWGLDPEVVFLNHGSFGACPTLVLEHQRALRERMERQPVRFFVRDLGARMDAAREQVAKFVGAAPERLVFVENATVGVNTALASAPLEPGDEVVITDHEYNASQNAARAIAARRGARVVVARLPFPVEAPAQIVEAIEGAVTPRTKLVMIDHVTSQTGMVLPVARVCARMRARGIDTLVDGAHAPGMVPLELESLGATYYTGNCHKWLCSPKSCAILWVSPSRKDTLRPMVTSHGANAEHLSAEARFLFTFDWVGTRDMTPALSVPRALEVMPRIAGCDWSGIMAHNRELARRGRQILCDALGIEPPCPASMLGALAAIQLPSHPLTRPTDHPLYLSPLQDALLEEYGIEVPVIPWPDRDHALLRISAQLHNHEPEYHYLASALSELLAR